MRYAWNARPVDCTVTNASPSWTGILLRIRCGGVEPTSASTAGTDASTYCNEPAASSTSQPRPAPRSLVNSTPTLPRSRASSAPTLTIAGTSSTSQRSPGW